MTVKRTPNPEEITKLLSKLKEGTPEYPAELLAARKAAFLKHAGTISIQGKGPGGQSGGQGGGGGPGATPGGGMAGSGFLMQALVGIGLIAAMLSAAFVYRDQINDLLTGNGTEAASAEVTPIPLDVATATPLATTALPPTFTLTPVPPTGTATGLAPTVVGGTPLIGVSTPGGTQDDNGLHLGQTPGTPAAPGQGNPGNPNQPDKPDNPKKPEKKSPPGKDK